MLESIKKQRAKCLGDGCCGSERRNTFSRSRFKTLETDEIGPPVNSIP